MDTDALGPVEAPLQRARLHIRGGKRRLRQGKISAGIVTLYDALVSAILWYVAVPERKNRLIIRDEDDLTSEKNLYDILIRSGVLDGEFDYGAFDALVDMAAESESPEHMKGYDYTELLKGLESVMTQIGVMPFDENALPPEDSSTF
jgi:hypothetical protein